MAGNLFEFELLLGFPEVVSLLHTGPKARAVAAEFAQAHRHWRRDAGFSRQNPVQGLTRDAQLGSRRHNIEMEGGEDSGAQDHTGVGGAAVGPLDGQLFNVVHGRFVNGTEANRPGERQPSSNSEMMPQGRSYEWQSTLASNEVIEFKLKRLC